mgnify:CR=1 FL=1
MTLNRGRNWAFIGVGLWFKICFRYAHVAEIGTGAGFYQGYVRAKGGTGQVKTVRFFISDGRNRSVGCQFSDVAGVCRRRTERCPD